jgi:hypothetical protein
LIEKLEERPVAAAYGIRLAAPNQLAQSVRAVMKSQRSFMSYNGPMLIISQDVKAKTDVHGRSSIAAVRGRPAFEEHAGRPPGPEPQDDRQSAMSRSLQYA